LASSLNDFDVLSIELPKWRNIFYRKGRRFFELSYLFRIVIADS
jgi:hypothetical protein